MTLDMEIEDMKRRTAKREREKGRKEKTIEYARRRYGRCSDCQIDAAF